MTQNESSPAEQETSFHPVEDHDDGLTVRVGSRAYHFRRTEEGTLVYSHHSSSIISDGGEDEKFDPTQYR